MKYFKWFDGEYFNFSLYDFGGRCGTCDNGIIDREETIIDYGDHYM